MTTQDLIYYILANIRNAFYVKGPIYLDGIQGFSVNGPTRESLLEDLAKGDQHEAVLKNLRDSLINGGSLKISTLIYAYHHLDHPECQIWGRSTDAYSRPTSESIRTESTLRIAAIDKWNEVLEEICVRVMNPKHLSIPAEEWARCKWHPNTMSEKTIYETNGNWPNSHGMYLSTAGWLDEKAKTINHYHKPASTL